MAAAAKAKAKADAEAEKQVRERKSAEVHAAAEAATTRQGSFQQSPEDSRESAETRIEAALLGAEESNDPGRTVAGGEETQAKQPKASQQKKPQVAGGFAVSKYDVVVMKKPKSEIDMPQLLEGSGSLKDLLKDGPRPTRRTSSNDNY